MNILITGGAGFIGSNFAHYWAKKFPQDNIIIYDKLTYAGNLESLKDLADLRTYSFVQGDICDLTAFENALEKFEIDTIVNFAAETHVDRSIADPNNFISTNIIGVFTILELMRRHQGIRLHHVSTDEVYGSLPIDDRSIKFTENSAYDPKSPYSASKASGDQLIRAYVNTYNLKATISNCSNNYGPYCFPEKLIPLTITRALNNELIPVYGNGDQIRDWIFVEDHCLGIELILQKGKIGETYLLGSNNEQQNIDMIKMVLRILDKPESLIRFVGDRLGHDKRYAIDYAKAKAELGYNPQGNLTDKLEQTVSWYLKNKTWWELLKKSADEIAEKYLLNIIK